MTDSNDKIAQRFIYSKFDADLNTFIFDDRIYKRLKKINTVKPIKCRRCFAATSCRSDCAANKAAIRGNFSNAYKGSYRCEETRKFIKSILVYLLDKKSICA